MKNDLAKKKALFAAFVIPSLALYIYFVLVPFGQTFYYCMTDWNGMTKNYHFIGFDNFRKLFQDNELWNAFFHNIKYCVYGGVIIFSMAIFNAVIVTQSNLKEKNFYRILFYVPNILSPVIICVIWSFIFSPNWGVLNSILRFLHLDSLQRVWIGDKSTVFGALLTVWVWCSIGFYMLLYIAAIEGISKDVFEAAEIDGAGPWNQFWHVTFPLIKETTKTSLVFFFMNAFGGIFSIVHVMTNGGPSGSSDVLTNYMYNEAFKSSRFGYATAIGVFMILVISLVSGIMFALTRDKD